ncbi:MAG TPA: SHOCT domain-containing protein [Coriobacteriia bacterium]|nr:SHOCT domain-containing protein [Coriobacteriia bacterium]
MMWLFFFPFLFVVPLVMFLTMRSGDHGVGRCGMSHPTSMQTPPAPPTGPDPVAIVRQRLAKGEITAAEYEEIRRALG